MNLQYIYNNYAKTKLNKALHDTIPQFNLVALTQLHTMLMMGFTASGDQ